MASFISKLMSYGGGWREVERWGSSQASMKAWAPHFHKVKTLNMKFYSTSPSFYSNFDKDLDKCLFTYQNNFCSFHYLILLLFLCITFHSLSLFHLSFSLILTFIMISYTTHAWSYISLLDLTPHMLNLTHHMLNLTLHMLNLTLSYISLTHHMLSLTPHMLNLTLSYISLTLHMPNYSLLWHVRYEKSKVDTSILSIPIYKVKGTNPFNYVVTLVRLC